MSERSLDENTIKAVIATCTERIAGMFADRRLNSDEFNGALYALGHAAKEVSLAICQNELARKQQAEVRLPAKLLKPEVREEFFIDPNDL